MAEGAESRIRQDLIAEIANLEQTYRLIKRNLAAVNYDPAAVGASIKDFKDSLNRASAYTLAFYNLHGQIVKIPWEQLFTTLDYALATVTVSPPQKQKTAVQTILSMAQSDFEQVLTYFAALKESLK
mgnify:FL=1